MPVLALRERGCVLGFSACMRVRCARVRVYACKMPRRAVPLFCAQYLHPVFSPHRPPCATLPRVLHVSRRWRMHALLYPREQPAAIRMCVAPVTVPLALPVLPPGPIPLPASIRTARLCPVPRIARPGARPPFPARMLPVIVVEAPVVAAFAALAPAAFPSPILRPIAVPAPVLRPGARPGALLRSRLPAPALRPGARPGALLRPGALPSPPRSCDRERSRRPGALPAARGLPPVLPILPLPAALQPCTGAQHA